MNIQPADRSRLHGGIFQLQNDKLMQNVACHLYLAHHGSCRHLRQCGVRNWILERPLFGQYEVPMDQLLNSDLYGHKKFVRFSPEMFRELIESVGPIIQKEKTTSSWIKDSHHPGHRGLLQDPDVWLQGGLQHHLIISARDM